MRALRENCIVLDTSILPKRPCMLDIEKFVINQLRLDMSQVKCIQPHNVKNVVYLGMKSSEAATSVAASHHLKHCMESDGKKIPIPIYVESSAVDVKIHDLPYDMDNVVIIEHLRHYGEVLAVRNEVWKSYFPGLINGVRVARMVLNQPIPSYITVDDEPTLVSYPAQVRTCRNCGRKSHPKQRCSEVTPPAASVAETENNTPSTSTTENNETKKQQQTSNEQQLNGKQWPTLPTPKHPKQQPEEQQNKTIESKRQRSIDSDSTDNETKKLNVGESTESDGRLASVGSSSDICEYTKQPYKIADYSHIADPVERQAIIEDDKRKIDAFYREMQLKKQKKKNVHN